MKRSRVDKLEGARTTCNDEPPTIDLSFWDHKNHNVETITGYQKKMNRIYKEKLLLYYKENDLSRMKADKNYSSGQFNPIKKTACSVQHVLHESFFYHHALALLHEESLEMFHV